MNAAKAVSAGLGAAVTTVLVWAANQYGHAQIPDIVQGAITTIVTTALAYFVPNADAQPVAAPAAKEGP
jgi:hypothetical protein